MPKMINLLFMGIFLILIFSLKYPLSYESVFLSCLIVAVYIVGADIFVKLNKKSVITLIFWTIIFSIILIAIQLLINYLRFPTLFS